MYLLYITPSYCLINFNWFTSFELISCSTWQFTHLTILLDGSPNVKGISWWIYSATFCKYFHVEHNFPAQKVVSSLMRGHNNAYDLCEFDTGCCSQWIALAIMNDRSLNILWNWNIVTRLNVWQLVKHRITLSLINVDVYTSM